jgi:hypothetical protein
LAGSASYHAVSSLIDGRYLDYWTFWELCLRFDVPMVPNLGTAGFNFDEIRRFANGNTSLDAEHLREGFVIKPIVERTDPRVGRVVLKYVSDDFLLAKKSDFAEV